MSRIVPETRLTEVLKQFSQEQCIKLADNVIDIFDSESIRRGYEEKMLDDMESSMFAYEVLWPIARRSIIGLPTARRRLFFFAPSEQDVLDRLSVAEVLLL